jgi:uncharacterized membrane protein YfcA
MFFAAVFIVAILSGATATVVGFGIGSLMTPLLAIRFGTTTAVALVTLPHAAATPSAAGVCALTWIERSLSGSGCSAQLVRWRALLSTRDSVRAFSPASSAVSCS